MQQLSAPKSPFDLFTSFTRIALQGFGGVVAIIQHELVDKKGWLTNEQFVEEWAVAQVLPGPNVVNLSLMLGARYFGLRGALAALAGMLLVPSIIALLCGALYATFSSNPGVIGATRGMSAAAAGLILATGLKMAAGLKNNPLGMPRCMLFGGMCFVCIALLHYPLLDVLIVLGLLAWWLSWRALGSRA
jgi:chromate transporter